jgi:hypothetical protein
MILASFSIDPTPFLGFLSLFLMIAGMIGFSRWLKSFGQQPIRRHFRRFFGGGLQRLETHDKAFPGYDLASVSRALSSFREDCCSEYTEIGATHLSSMRLLLDTIELSQGRALKPTALTYQRVPVDVHEEASFSTGGLSLAMLKPDAGRERLAILLSAHYTHPGWEDIDSQHAPRQQITVSIACRSAAVADRFFQELEERRKRHSIYRGKVIDPVVGPAGIMTIGFRPVHHVREEDLILPEAVKDLLRRAVLGFCAHTELLRELGIDLKRGILLHGPPGTGKTSISLYLAGQLTQYTVCFVSGERLLYPREICRMARYLQPAMIVFEDIDLVAQERNANGLATVLGELMNQIDGCEPSDQVLFVMNTNSLERLEHAVKNRPGRVDQIIEIPLPGRDERWQLLQHFARTLRVAVDDWSRVLKASEGVTPAVLKEIVKRAVVNAIERDGHEGKASAVTLEESDLLLAAEQVQALRDPERVPGRFGFGEEGA